MKPRKEAAMTHKPAHTIAPRYVYVGRIPKATDDIVMTDERRAIIAAFYHKGRKTHTEWLLRELAERLGTDPLRLYGTLDHMKRDGLLLGRSVKKGTGDLMGWSVSVRALRMVTA